MDGKFWRGHIGEFHRYTAKHSRGVSCNRGNFPSNVLPYKVFGISADASFKRMVYRSYKFSREADIRIAVHGKRIERQKRRLILEAP